MSVKIGSVIKSTLGLYVVTHITDGMISKTEKLEDFIAKNTLVKEGGEWKTINEVVEKRCDMYLNSGIEIIEE